MLEVCGERRNCKRVVSVSGREDGQRNYRMSVQQHHRTLESKISAIPVRMATRFHSWTPFIVRGCDFVVEHFQSFLNSGALTSNLSEESPK